MHNLHLARIKAESHKDACEAVLSYIDGWGDDNNWRTIGGAICEDGTAQEYDKGSRWRVETDKVQEQIDSLNSSCFAALQGGEYLYGHRAENISKILSMPVEEMFSVNDWMDLYALKRFFDFLLKTTAARQECEEAYDIFKSPDFFAYDYGEFGLTDMGDNGYNEEELKDCKMYIVLIDMHT